MVLEQKRLALSDFLHKISGVNGVYYSPPTGAEMNYPCITYDLEDVWAVHADNIPYLTKLHWIITVIDENPDSEISNVFFNLRNCRFDRKFQSDDLNHFVFSLYF